MPGAGDTIATFAGPAGVGALCLLGVFLFLDGWAPDLFPTFEHYAKTASWGVVAAIPTLAISYVLGLSLMIASERALVMIGGPPQSTEVADVARIGTMDSPASQAYVEALRNRAVLAGGALALVILAIGAISDARNLPGLKEVIVGSAAATVLLAAAAVYLAAGEGHRAHAIAEAVVSVPPSTHP